MNKRPVIWNPVKCNHRTGGEACDRLPSALDIGYRGTFLSRIMSMPKKRPLGFASAIRMLSLQLEDNSSARRHGFEVEHPDCFPDFVAWISSLDYHIELTGDEFEPCRPQELTA